MSIREPIFRVWDKKYKKWAGVRGEKGRSFDEYWREKWAKESGLMWMDLEGFVIDDNGYASLNDECGGTYGLDPKRFQVCFDKEVIESLPLSESKTYYTTPPQQEK